MKTTRRTFSPKMEPSERKVPFWANSIINNKKGHRSLSFLLALVLLLSLCSLPVSAEGIAFCSVEDSEYVDSIEFYLQTPGDLGIEKKYNSEQEYYEFLLPDYYASSYNGTFFIQGGTDGKFYLPQIGIGENASNMAGVNVAKLTTSRKKAQTLSKAFTSIRNGTAISTDFQFIIGNGTARAQEMAEPLEIIRYHGYLKATLNSLQIESGEQNLGLDPAFSPTTYIYSASMPDSSVYSVSLDCTVFTALKTDENAGTVISFSDDEGNEIECTTTTDSDGKTLSASFSLDALPQKGERQYINVNIDYSDPKVEFASSSYKIVFMDSSDLTPWVEVIGQTDLSVNKQDFVSLEVKAYDLRTGIEGENYKYQWFYTEGQESAENHVGSIIEGATERTYQPNTQFATGDGILTPYYFCRVSNTVDEVEFVAFSEPIRLYIAPNYAYPPIIMSQPESISAVKGTTDQSISITAKIQEPQTSISFEWFIADDLLGANARAITEEDGKVRPATGQGAISGKTSTFIPTTEIIGDRFFFCEVVATVPNGDAKRLRSDVVSMTVTAIPGLDSLAGDGTENNPYLIDSQADLLAVKQVVESGYGLEGHFLKLTRDLTLPDKWEPIGDYIDPTKLVPYTGRISTENGANIYPFMGTFDGDGHLITIPAGGKGLFNYVRRANIKNLNLYGEQIIGSALIACEAFSDFGETGDYNQSATWTANIDHVTLKSGSHTSRSGLLLGTGSSANKVSLTNCIVEKDVVVGAEGSDFRDGSIIGSLNGYMQNCISYATVFGTGGLVGWKNTSMGTCAVVSSAFLGSVQSTSFAGGIVGAGYGYEEFLVGTNTAPNTITVTICNCYVNADITGSTLVGGIFGGEPLLEQCWANGIQYIQDNYFAGTITVKNPNENTHVGALIGYIRGVNRYNYIGNNYYLDSCGVDKGIGLIAHVDTDARDFGIHDGVFYFNTSKDSVEAIKQYIDPDSSYTAVSSRNLNRSDDPAGADADKLTKAVTAAELADGTVVNLLNQSETSFHNWEQGEKYPELSDEPIPYLLTITGDYQKDYYIGDELSTAGMVFTLTYSDGKTKTVNAGELSFSGFDSSKQGECTVVAAFGAVSASFKVTILKKDAEGITVYFTLLGDDLHDSDTDGNVHTLASGNLQTWITKTAYTLDGNATVLDLIRKALAENGMSITETEKLGTVYIPSVTRNNVELGEFDNGTNSGWLYTINGKDSSLGVAQQFLSDGDEIVFHYSDDYTKEDYAMGWTGTIDNQSGSTAKVTVADAKTGTVKVDCALACAVIGQKADGSYALLPASVSGNTVTFDASAYTKVIVRIKGDITGDGKVDSSDTLLMKQLVAGIKEPDAITALLLDLTGDGKINSSDTLKMKRVAAGLDSLAW